MKALLSLAVLICAAAVTIAAAVQTCTTSGCLDATFGSGGSVQVDVGPGENEFAQGQALLPEGGVAVFGTVTTGAGESHMAVVRLTSSGGLESTFGSGGIATIEFTALLDSEDARGIAVAPDLSGNPADFDLILTATVQFAKKGNNSTMGCGVARLNSDGSLETGFGVGGKAHFLIQSGTETRCDDGAVDAAGRIVVTGASGGFAAFARLDAYGAFDASFGSGGKVVTSVAERAYSTVIDSSGRILASTRSYVLRRLPSGAADSSFGSGGVVATGVYNGGWGGLAIDGGGRIFAVGAFQRTVQTSVKPPRQTTTTDVGVVALLDSGQRDMSFGTQGLTAIDIGRDQATGVAIDDLGRVVVSADVFEGPGFVVIRLTPAGLRDVSFGDNGIVLTAGPLADRANAGVISTSDGLVVAGQENNGGEGAILVRRYLH